MTVDREFPKTGIPYNLEIKTPLELLMVLLMGEFYPSWYVQLLPEAKLN